MAKEQKHVAGNIFSSLKKQGKWDPVGDAKPSQLAGTPFKSTYSYDPAGGTAIHDMANEAAVDTAAAAHEAKWASAQEASGGDLNKQVSIRNASEKGSDEWTNSQNLINKYLGSSTTHRAKQTPALTGTQTVSVGSYKPELMSTGVEKVDLSSLEQVPVATVDEISPKQQKAANKVAKLQSRKQTGRRDIRIAKQQMKAAGADRKDIRAAKTKMKAEGTIDQIEAARKAGKMGKVARLQKKVKRQKNRHTRLTK